MKIPAHDDRGDTLIEVLVAVVVVGLAFAALLGGLATGISASGTDRQDANVTTLLQSAGESVLDQDRNAYVNCALASSYNPTAGVSLPSGWSTSTVRVSAISWWDGSSFVPSTSAPQCYDTTTDGMLHLQLITVTVSTPTGLTSASRSFVKRAP